MANLMGLITLGGAAATVLSTGLGTTTTRIAAAGVIGGWRVYRHGRQMGRWRGRRWGTSTSTAGAGAGTNTTPTSSANPTDSESTETTKDKETQTPNPSSSPSQPPPTSATEEEQEKGALTRRLEEMAESALLTNPTLAKKVVSGAVPASDYGFSDELRAQLAEKLKDSEFRSNNAGKISVAELPDYAGRDTKVLAEARAWTGQETTQDLVHRMLQDAHRELPREFRGSRKGAGGGAVAYRPSGKKVPSSLRIARARDASLEYALNTKTSDSKLSEEEKELAERHAHFASRFEPTARPSASIRALESLAEQKIAAAIANGSFRNLPRGKPTDELMGDAQNPFVDTTEFFLNRIIQRQEIVPPWIEKQGELTRAMEGFRGEMGREWLRHICRRFSAQGGGTEAAVSRAEENARLESEGQGWRDTDWLSRHKSYYSLALKAVNDLCRSYNLLAPDAAKKPYLVLEREFERCFRTMAGEVGREIRRRAEKSEVGALGGRGGGGVLEGLVGGRARVYDEDPGKRFGFRELVREWWGKGKKK